MDEPNVKISKRESAASQSYYLSKGYMLKDLEFYPIKIKEKFAGVKDPQMLEVFEIPGPSMVIAYPSVARMAIGALPESTLEEQVWENAAEKIQRLEQTMNDMWTGEQVDAAVEVAIRPYKKAVNTIVSIFFILLLEVVVASLFLILRCLL